MKLGICILSAGESKRLGSPKQLVRFKNEYLLQRIINEVENFAECHKMIITGAHRPEIKQMINLKSFTEVFNKNWKEGIGSSIRQSAKMAIKENFDGLLLVTTDQPFLSATLLSQLLNAFYPGNEMIISSEYNGIIGIPVLFDQCYFEELTQLSGDLGAKKIIDSNIKNVKAVHFADGNIDVDTIHDVDYLKCIENGSNY